jgi:GNAT superfamily N-acetyltransferase
MVFLSREGESKEPILPRGIRVRRGDSDDEFAAFEVMRRTMGYEMNWMHHARMRHHLRVSPHSSFWLAEETPRFGAAKVIGYARSVVRERVWSLTEFFILPGHQRQGIGTALLEHCLADGEQAGMDTQLVLASHHPGADSLYVRKAACFPRIPMLLLSGPLASLRPFPGHAPLSLSNGANALDAPMDAAGTRLCAEPMVLTEDVQSTLDALDREMVGFARACEHAHWAAEMAGPDGASCLFRRTATETAEFGEEGQIVGYAYIGPHLSGPALARDPADLPYMLTHVAQRARAQADPERGLLYPAEHYWAVAGTNETVLSWLLECGWQIVFQYLFMSSRPLGRFDRYVCHNPLYLL